MTLASSSEQVELLDDAGPVSTDLGRKRTRQQPSTVVWASAAAFLLLVLIAIGSFFLFAQTRLYSQESLRRQSVMLDISRLNSLIREAESGQRGDLLTGRPLYLDAFTNARKILPDAEHRLLTDAGNDPELASDVQTLLRLSDQKIEELQKTVDLNVAGKSADALAFVSTDQGLMLMRAIRDLSQSMIRRQRETLTGVFDKSNDAARLYVIVSITAALLIVLLAFISIRSTSRLITDLRGAQRDLEASKESLEQAVEERTTDLREANEELQRYSYIVSHDLRSPLVNVMGFTSEVDALHKDALRMLEQNAAGQPVPPEEVETLGADFKEAIGFIKASTDRMDRLIAAILKLAREGHRNFNIELLDMKNVVETAVSTVSHRTSEVGAEIGVGNLPNVAADRLAMDQVIGNLLDNALKYLKPGRQGKIAVTGRRGRRATIFQIADNGRGIDPKDHQRIFELFRRSGNQTVPGEGIGLAHVRALVRAMEGVITCESVLGEGTTFTLRFPHRSDVPKTRLS